MNNDIKNVQLGDQEENEKDFQLLQLSDCDVPVGCPLGANPAMDVWPNHW